MESDLPRDAMCNNFVGGVILADDGMGGSKQVAFALWCSFVIAYEKFSNVQAVQVHSKFYSTHSLLSH